MVFMLLRCVPFALVMLAVFPAVTSAATYFVTKEGSDENNCMEEQLACLTIGRAALLADRPGDVVRIGPGVFRERITVKHGGAPKAPITYTGSSGSTCPTISVNGSVVPLPRPVPRTQIQGFNIAANHIVVHCFHIVASPSNGERGAGVYINSNIDGVTVSENFIDGSATPGRPWAGVAMKSGIPPDSFAFNITVDRNYVRNTGYGFMIFCRRNCLFENNEVEELKAEAGRGDNDYSRVFGEYVTMRGNYFHGNSIADCIGCHIDCFQTYNVGRLDNVARNITIDSNTCFNAHQAIIIRDTTSKEAGQYASHRNWTIINNVLGYGPIGARATWCGLFDHVGNVVFEHNLCVATGTVGYLNGSTGTHRFNIHLETGWMPYTTTLPGWREGRVQATGNLLFRSKRGLVPEQWQGDIVNHDPLLVNVSARNFLLKEESPARNSALGSMVLRDRAGRLRPRDVNPDIGPFQYKSSSTSQTAEPPRLPRSRSNVQQR
jgi:hypothetical protein